MNWLCIILSLFLTAQVRIRNYFPQMEPARDLSYLTNDSCESIKGIDSTMMAFIKREEIAGASLAISRGDSLIYVKSYGYADREKKVKMQPYNRMRIASVSKLITAVGIMKLCEEGLISLDDKVFTPDGPLGKCSFCGDIRDRRMLNITIEQLLRHKGGFSNRAHGDLFFGNDLSSSGDELLSKALRYSLGFTPGATQEYSNVGFYILGRIIEEVTGRKYHEWIKSEILEPCGCHDFDVAGNSILERKDHEAKYYVHPDAVPGTCYTGNNITRLGGAGSWIATAPELCKFVACIDNDPVIRDILTRESIDAMTEWFDEATFSLGWNDTNPDMVWTRTGSFCGTSAIIKYFGFPGPQSSEAADGKGDCWIIITNSSTWHGARVSRYTAGLIRRMRRQYLDQIPKRDLFH